MEYLGASERTWEMIQICMAHNHPTGDPSPSRDDIALTREVRTALKTVGVSLHDHIIIGRKGHCSLRSMNVIDGWK
jgi:DNA repair protein RadC